MSLSALILDVPVRPSVDEIAASLAQLPASPAILPRLNSVVHDEDFSFHDLIDLLRLDPGLCARFLHSGCNLAAARGQTCLSLEEAVQRLGIRYVTATINRIAKAQVLARPICLYGLDADEFWRWSVACALAAELLAGYTGEKKALAHSAGLLHAVGVVAIDQWAQLKAPSLLFMPHNGANDFSSSEHALLGCTQAEVAAATLHRWALPEILIEPIRWQDRPLEAPSAKRLACLLNAAKWLRTVICAEDDFKAPPLPDREVLDQLGLTPEQLCHCVVEIRIRIGQVRNLVEAVAA